MCALADHLGDLPRHLYVFRALCDLILVADAAWIDAVAGEARNRASDPRLPAISAAVLFSTRPLRGGC